MTFVPYEDSDQPVHLPSLISLPCPHEETLCPLLPTEHTAKILIRPGRCAGWCASSMGAQIILLVLSGGSSQMPRELTRNNWSLATLSVPKTDQTVWMHMLISKTSSNRATTFARCKIHRNLSKYCLWMLYMFSLDALTNFSQKLPSAFNGDSSLIFSFVRCEFLF